VNCWVKVTGPNLHRSTLNDEKKKLLDSALL
jgi:hypothetical protein